MEDGRPARHARNVAGRAGRPSSIEMLMVYNVTIDGTVFCVDLDLDRDAGQWRCRVDGRAIPIDARLAQPDVLSILIDGAAFQVRRERIASGVRIWVGERSYATEVSDPRSLRSRKARTDSGKGPRPLVAPMPGKVVRFLVGENSPVEAGQGVVVVEAMKMQNEIKSPKKGLVRKLAVAEGAAVNAGDVLAVVE